MVCTHNTTRSLQPASQPEAEATSEPADEEVVDFFFVFVMVWWILFALEELPFFTRRTPASSVEASTDLHGTKIFTFLSLKPKIALAQTGGT